MTSAPPSRLVRAAAVFGLGGVVSAHEVAGGLSNELWRVTSDLGQFAVKVMRTNADSSSFRENVEAAFDIERRAHERGVPSPEPLPAPDGRCLARIDGRWVRAHRWVDADPADPHRDREAAGALIAHVHAVGEEMERPLDDEPWDVAGWRSLADHADGRLAEILDQSAARLAELEAVTAAPGLVTTHGGSHGDLDPKNTLVADGVLMAVDWDAAGLRCRAREAVAVALDWSDGPDGLRQVMAAYRAAGGAPVPPDTWVLGGWVAAHGGWLVHNATTQLTTERGRSEAMSAAERLLRLHTGMAAYLEALKDMR